MCQERGSLEENLGTPKDDQTRNGGIRNDVLNWKECASPGRVVQVPARADGEERLVAVAGSGPEG